MQKDFGGALSAEQIKAIDHILDASQLASVVGLAGAGKSTMLATAAEAWARSGMTVHGAALAAKAAAGLESASGIPSRTLASLETSWDNGNEPIKKGDILVIDEAGMLGTRQLSRVTQKLNEVGAKLVLVGDPDQLQPIEAGQPFRDLVSQHGAARLTEIHRQTADWQKQASRDLAAGRVTRAMDAYAAHGAVTLEESYEDTLTALVDRYVLEAQADPKASRLVLAHRRRDVHALNQAIRAALREEDARENVLLQTETGPRAFAVGDRIVLTRNDKSLGVKNGMLGSVVRVSNRNISIKLDDGITLSIDALKYRHFDHGYAVTIHKSQGATVDTAYVLASRSMDEHLAYVAMTRHRNSLQVFVNAEERPPWALQRNDRCHVGAAQVPEFGR